MEIGKDLMRASQLVKRQEKKLPDIDGVAYCRTRLAINRELTVEEWAAIGECLEGVRSAEKWWLGDWLVYGGLREDGWGHKYEQAFTIFDEDMYPLLRDFASVSQAWPQDERNPDASWSHHATIRTLPREDRLRLIQEGHTVQELRKIAREYKKRIAAGASLSDIRQTSEDATVKESLTDDPEPEEEADFTPKTGRVAFDAKPLRRAWTEFVKAIYATRKQFPHLAGPCDAVLASGDELTRDLENLIREGEK